MSAGISALLMAAAPSWGKAQPWYTKLLPDPRLPWRETPREVAILFAVVVPLIVWMLVLMARGRRRGRRDGNKPMSAGWGVGAGVGILALALATLASRWPLSPTGRFDMMHEILRLAGLGCGVVFVMFTLGALLPLGLDALERYSFVGMMSSRILRASKGGFLTVISVLSILGVAVSSCALCSVTSIMGGFGHDLKRKILGNTAHVIVDVPHPSGFDNYEPALSELRGVLEKQGAAATPVVGGDAMASSVTNTAGMLMRGIEADSIGDVINLKANIEVGRFEYLLDPAKLLTLPADEIVGRGPGGEPYYRGPRLMLPAGSDPTVLAPEPEAKVFPGIVLGRELAKSLHANVGDELTVLSPMGELGPTGIMPRSRKFRVAAIFYSGMYEYDASHGYVLLDVAQKFFSMEGRISKIDVRIPVPEQVSLIRPELDAVVASLNKTRAANPPELEPGEREPDPLRIRDWKEMNQNLFSALKLEKLATFIILSIAIAVASFCIICTLLLMVTEKSKDIAVLKALGASDGSILRVFLLEGVLIGAIGVLLGVAVALSACLGLSWTGIRLDPDVYYIDRLPVNVDAGDYVTVALAALLICTLATIYPALTASRVRPVDGLRYE